MELKEFIENLVDQFDDVDINDISAETAFQELDEWSSLTAMGIIAMAKINYGKTITGLEVRHCKTVEDLYKMIESK